MKIYELLKRMITLGNYNKEDMINKLNTFYAVGQITTDEYLELMGMINPPIEEPKELEELE